MALNHKSEIAQRFSRAATRYDSYAGMQHRLATIAQAWVPQQCNGLVLDIGCATGLQTQQLPGQVVGLDLSLAMLSEAQRIYSENQHWINADMDALPFVGNSFEHVYSSMALQWSVSPQQIASEISRVLTSRGKATLLIPVAGSFAQLIATYQCLGLASGIHTFTHERDWLNAFSNARLRCIANKIIMQTDEYENLTGVLGSIAKVGASFTQNKPVTRLSKGLLKALEQCYPKSKDGLLPLDYRCLLLSLEK